MKYLGKITDNKDLVTKEYVDNADATKAPAYTISNVDIGEGAPLATGTLYFVYED